jgi:PIN domain nuclease of toxin-antitoxin system
MMLLDTHALIWLDEGSHRLGKESLSLIDLSLQSNELSVASISFWEVAMLIVKGRLEMQMTAEIWRQDLIDNGLQEISLTGNIAIQAALLKDFHGDPADRIIVATALHATATLCTADKQILSWKQNLLRLDAQK